MTARRGFWPLRDLPVVLWLLAAVVATLIHPFVPAPRWLMIHLLLLGAVSHAILVWSRHFADALLHAALDDRPQQARRLVLLNAGVVGVVAGMLASVWPVVVAGAAAVAAAVVWHGWTLVRMLRTALPKRFSGTVRYYVAATCLLPVGATLGTLLARGLPDPWHVRLLVAHVTINVLGWMGLTVVGTLVTLWPTMLRTRISPGAEQAAARALPVLIASVVLTAAAAAVGWRPLAVLALLGYVAGLGVVAGSFVVPMRRKPPASFATASVLAAVAWLVGCVIAVAAGFALADSWAAAEQSFRQVTPFLAAGFGAQVLLGALSYLVPVALGGGPTPVRTATDVLDRGFALRVSVVNAGLLVCALPVPSLVRVLASLLVLVALAAWLPLLVLAIRASRRDREVPATQRVARQAAPQRPPRRVTAPAAAGLAAVALAVAAGVAADPAALGQATSASAAAGAAASGETTTVQVRAEHMRFTPSTITVPAGNRLVIELTNADDDVHDLALDDGTRSGRLAPGDSTRVDVGVVGRDLEGWCTLVGHRQMGMVLQVEVVGAATTAAAAADGHAHSHGPGGHAGEADAAPPQEDAARNTHGEAAEGDAAALLDFRRAPAADFRAHDAALPPLPRSRVHRRTITVRDVVREVAPGVTQRLWTYDGTVPGPALHGRVGDRFEITLVNAGTAGHSIDFHAGSLAPAGPMRTIAPGESLVYRFRATHAGIWMYHCSTMPMAAHIANGLFGAVVIEPPGLPPVDRSYLLVQSELYLGLQGGEVDAGKVLAESPDAVVFNGYANQYDARPLPVRVGERVRVWVLDAGPSRSSSFHVVGGIFDTTYSEGAWQLRRGSGGAQALGLQPAQGGFVELSFPERGDYPFVSHVMVDAERGAHGLFRVSG